MNGIRNALALTVLVGELSLLWIGSAIQEGNAP